MLTSSDLVIFMVAYFCSVTFNLNEKDQRDKI